MRVGEPGRGWDNNQFTALVSVHIPEQIPLQFLLLQLLEVAVIHKKFMRMILTGTDSPFVIVVLLKLYILSYKTCA